MLTARKGQNHVTGVLYHILIIVNPGSKTGLKQVFNGILNMNALHRYIL